MEKEITIMPVHFSDGSKKYLELNHDLVSKLNPRENWIWMIGDNSHPSRAHEPLDAKKFPFLVKGFDQTNPADLADYYGEAMRHKKKIICYWHGATLNKMIKHVETRFALILDNNFFILRKNWVDYVTGHMKKNNLGFFGVTNPPAAYLKYRYFPEVHCMFIDLEKVSKDDLDFMPFFDDKLPAYKVSIRKFRKKVALHGPHWLAKCFGFAIADRLRVGLSRDVGYRIYKKYGGSAVKSDYALPVLKPPPGKFRKFIDLPCPDSLSFLPKRSGSYTTESFLPPETESWGGANFEEFMWRDAPFGFHIRGRAYVGSRAKNNEDLFQFIKSLISKLPL